MFNHQSPILKRLFHHLSSKISKGMLLYNVICRNQGLGFNKGNLIFSLVYVTVRSWSTSVLHQSHQTEAVIRIADFVIPYTNRAVTAVYITGSWLQVTNCSQQGKEIIFWLYDLVCAMGHEWKIYYTSIITHNQNATANQNTTAISGR